MTTVAWLAHSRLSLWVILLCAAGFTMGLGILGMGHGGPSSTNADTRFLYLAGVYWHEGMSAYGPTLSRPVDPWLLEAVSRYDFAYPPQIAPFCLFLATFSPAGARGIMTGVNILSALILAAVSVRLARDPEAKGARGSRDASAWLIPALVLGNPSTAFVIWAGQTTLMVTAALLLGWYYARRGRCLIGGLLLAISTIKPQVSFLAILWLVLERRWRALGVAAISILILAAVPLVVSGPLSLVREWAAAAQEYTSGTYNALGSRMVFGLRNMLYAAGLDVPDLLPVGVLLCGVLWYFRSRVTDEDVLAILVSLSLLFGFTHSYDIAALTPMVPAFWRHLRERPGGVLVALGLMLVITFPSSLLEPLHLSLLYQARVVAMLGAVMWLLAMSIKRAAGSQRMFATDVLASWTGSAPTG